MDLLRLSTQQVEFEYNKYDNMQSQITIFNDSMTPIAYKFKATNLNIFLVRPPMGVLQPHQSQLVNITLHCKVLENNAIADFNEKLLLISSKVPAGVVDVGSIFMDKMRQFEKQRINLAILTKDRKLIAQSSGTSNQMFQSVNKQFGVMEPTQVVATPTPDKARSEAEYFNNKFEAIQQHVLAREQELLSLQRYNNSLLQIPQSKKKSDALFFLILLAFSFTLSYIYQDEIINKLIRLQ